MDCQFIRGMFMNIYYHNLKEEEVLRGSSRVLAACVHTQGRAGRQPAPATLGGPAAAPHAGAQDHEPEAGLWWRGSRASAAFP